MVKLVNKNIKVDLELWRSVKADAAKCGKSLQDYFSELLWDRLAKSSSNHTVPARSRPILPVPNHAGPNQTSTKQM